MSWHTVYLHLKIFYKNKFGFIKKANQEKHIGEIFKQIYLKNYWGSTSTVSGPGSELYATEKLILQLNQLLEDFKINSILDVPCGDFNWMQHVELKGRKYSGADIVEELIESNNRKYQNADIDFNVLDITCDQLPCVDLIICRDGLVHFCYKDIYNALRRIKQSGSKYLLMTSFNNFPANYNINTGEWRPLNLLKKPFRFPTPLYCLSEFIPDKMPIPYTKQMCLWELNSLQIPDDKF